MVSLGDVAAGLAVGIGNAFDDRLRLQNQAVLRDIARDHADVRVFSAHSEHELLSLRRERAERGPAAVA